MCEALIKEPISGGALRLVFHSLKSPQYSEKSTSMGIILGSEGKTPATRKAN